MLKHFSDSLCEQIIEFQTLPSTQTYAIDAIKNEGLKPPFCIHTAEQTQALGSRGNGWDSVEKALMFSIAIPIHSLPKDLKIESSAIFFGVIIQQFLHAKGSQVWLKYPNDLYIQDKKIGGILTQKVRDNLVCGMGINLRSNAYATLEVSITRDLQPICFLQDFFQSFKSFTSWKQIFSIYKLEFRKNDSFSFHFNEKRICLKDTRLNEDGSLSFENQKIYSLR